MYEDEVYPFWDDITHTEGCMTNWKSFPEGHYIYCLKNMVNGKVYVGRTENLRRRIYYHINKSQKPNSYVNSKILSAIRKYGAHAFMVYSCYERINLLEESEYDFIDLAREMYDNNTYNIIHRRNRGNYSSKNTLGNHKSRYTVGIMLFHKDTGEFYKEFKSMSEAARYLKIGISSISKALKSDLTVQLKGFMFIKSKDYDSSKCYKSKKVKHVMTQETKDKISKTLKGKKLKNYTEAHKKARSIRMSKKVNCIFDNGLRVIFDSQMQAAQCLSISDETLSKILKGYTSDRYNFTLERVKKQTLIF